MCCRRFQLEHCRRRLKAMCSWMRPAHVCLASRIATWVILLPILKFILSLPTLVRLLAPKAHVGDQQDEAHERRAMQLIDALYQRGLIGCLERSLLVYRFCSRGEGGAQLVIGVRKDGGSIMGHAWVTIHGRPVHETADAIADYAPVLVFGPGPAIRAGA